MGQVSGPFGPKHILKNPSSWLEEFPNFASWLVGRVFQGRKTKTLRAKLGQFPNYQLVGGLGLVGQKHLSKTLTRVVANESTNNRQ